MENKIVIVRSCQAGVFFGTLVERNGAEVKMSNCRRVWYWDGANSLSQLAMEGSKKPKDCQITMPVDEIVILDVIEIIPCTQEAIDNINNIPSWKI